jgi:alpha-beta hydrolase superfamily lysophospholipase
MGSVKSFLAMMALLTLLAPAVQAQGKSEPVRFKTVDGVNIKGRFYPGENQNAPTVLMLHNVNENSKKKNWLNLAEELQKKGYAVLTFDFRGHGDSTTVEPEIFWSAKHKFNLLVKRSQGEIDSKFDKRYLPALVNDIAAAKAFLDKKNDAKECNSSRIILIGSETGATLGALWLKSEWQRYRVKLNDFGKPLIWAGKPVADRTKPPEGNAVIGAVWLSISPTLGSRTVSVANLLATPARDKGVPMIFMYSDGDKTGKTLAKDLEKTLVPNKKSEKYRFTAAVEATNLGKLKGAELLQNATIKGILGYLDEATKDRGEDWMEREFRRTAYVWTFGNTPAATFIAKLPDDMNLIFSTYENFLR